mmetsp:Transcript_116019/g.361454  ORF Transcript_116019/g.361454 Transcript_116019/m.361454 type:complete len:216 (+) Transcript_116019:169-816(+)
MASGVPLKHGAGRASRTGPTWPPSRSQTEPLCCTCGSMCTSPSGTAGTAGKPCAWRNLQSSDTGVPFRLNTSARRLRSCAREATPGSRNTSGAKDSASSGKSDTRTTTLPSAAGSIVKESATFSPGRTCCSSRKVWPLMPSGQLNSKLTSIMDTSTCCPVLGLALSRAKSAAHTERATTCGVTLSNTSVPRTRHGSPRSSLFSQAMPLCACATPS